MTRAEIEDLFFRTALRHMESSGLATGLTSVNRVFMAAMSSAFAEIFVSQAEFTNTRHKFDRVFSMLELLGKQIAEHNTALQRMDAPEPSEPHGLVLCYCGTKHTTGPCPTCGKGRKVASAKPVAVDPGYSPTTVTKVESLW